MTTLFTGSESLRVRGERTTFVLTLCSLPVTVILLGWLLQHQVSWQEIALLLIGAMLYVAFARGRLLGGGLRIHAGQFGAVHSVVDECARMMRMPMPHVFIRDDPFVPVIAIGIGDPYAIVISAQYVEHFQPDELRFLIGRELGHIASGHTRYTSLLSSNGRENGVIAVAFGAWLRKIDDTDDRAGLLCCGSLDAAMRAIAVSAFGPVGRRVDLGAFAGQLKELHAEPSLRLAEWTASTPYATNRIAALHRFARDPLYQTWSHRFAANAGAPPVSEAAETVYASFWRRTGAFFVDVIVVQTLVPAARALGTKLTVTDSDLKNITAPAAAPRVVHDAVKSIAANPHTSITFNNDALLWLALGVYAVVLVALIGQTFGMMVLDLRVIRANHDPRVGFGRAIGRYASLVASMLAVVGLLSMFRRIQPYEKWSRTRLVSGSVAIR
ncbi:MAG TPA: RDD family protein [Dongiaceae bacterium]|nr:RDD family protein [Dongiaceae bacterium]